MASPFPGMNPYLESTDNWRSFHHLLADEIMAALNQELSAKYYAVYDRRIDYTQPIPPPQLRPAMQEWWEAFRVKP